MIIIILMIIYVTNVGTELWQHDPATSLQRTTGKQSDLMRAFRPCGVRLHLLLGGSFKYALHSPRKAWRVRVSRHSNMQLCLTSANKPATQGSTKLAWRLD